MIRHDNLQTNFATYYRSVRFREHLLLPPRPNFHHYRIQKWNSIFARLTKTIRSASELVNWISSEVPRNAYFTPAEWLDPSNVRRSRGRIQDYMLSSPLFFDIETEDRLTGSAARMAGMLIDYVKREYRRSPSWIVFSGRRGFHIYYWDWDDIPIEYERGRDRIKEFIKTRRRIIRELEESGIHVDPTVTADPWRIMRIPGTLHGESGLAAIPVHDVLDFSVEQANLAQPRF